jgi:hypothetical protein
MQNNTTATLIYVDGTEGWRVIDTGSLSSVFIQPFIVAAQVEQLLVVEIIKFIHLQDQELLLFLLLVIQQVLNSVDYLVSSGGSGGAGDSPGQVAVQEQVVLDYLILMDYQLHGPSPI